MSCKKLINSVEGAVDDMLEGYVTSNPGVRILKGHRVIVRCDVEELVRSGKVGVVCGGGSGHEPAMAGYVGRGFLAASVAGSVFASPPPQEILPAIRAVARNNTGGCLLMVANYTGDRLNFGLAFERARQEGIKIAMIVVGEDCALTSHDRTAGRRGLVGYIVTSKIAGALAEMGRSLEDIVEICTTATKQMGTIGLSWSACSVPGSGPTFSLGEGEMELGLGAHGEAGVKRIKMTTAKEAVKIMIDHMRNPDNSTHLKVNRGDRVALFLNNLGGTTHFEMNIIMKEALLYLENSGIAVDRCYSGPFLTSQEMAGVSIMLLHLNDVIIQCLDAPTDSPHWPRPLLPPGVKVRQTPQPLVLDDVEDKVNCDVITGVVVDTESASTLYDVVQHVCERLIEAESTLNHLDTEGGDGDTGSTLGRGARAILMELGEKGSPGLPVSRPYSLALAMARTAEIHMGGASGALHSLFLTSAARHLKTDASPASWNKALEEGINTIKRYGGAQEGDRTMLDPLCAASRVLKTRLSQTTPLDAFTDAVMSAEKSAAETATMRAYTSLFQSAEKYAAETATMRAYAGRASYVNPDLLTRPDPGAASVAIWLRAILDKLT